MKSSRLFSQSSLFITLLILMTCGVVIQSYSFTSGFTGRTNRDGGLGCNCHGDRDERVSVAIVGKDTLFPGQSETYQVVLTGGPTSGAGVNVASSVGILQIEEGGGLRELSGELTHNGIRNVVAGNAIFSFRFTAPQEGSQAIIYAVGNRVNNNGAASGDQWNHAPNKVITIASPLTVEPAERLPKKVQLLQNYPNPFNPSTQIPFTLSERGLVLLEVYDVTGKKVATVVNQSRPAGNYLVPFSAHDYGLSSGTYIYTLTVNGVTNARQMILLK